MSISFFHIGVNNLKATEYVVKNIREHHPDAFYFLGTDAASDLSPIAHKYNCHYVHFLDKLGAPTQPYGYDIDRVLKFLERFRMACERCDTTHIMMAEDDVLVVKPVTINPEWEMACHDIRIGNIIPESVHDMIERFNGKRPTFKQYGGGGGSIYNVKTFLDNYSKVVKFFETQGDFIMKNLYPTFGWIDCFMVVYYYLCGKDYSVNEHLTDTHHHVAGYDYDGFVASVPDNIEIINNYKKYYYE